MERVFDYSVLLVILLLVVTTAVVVRAAFRRSEGEVGGWEIGGAGRRIRAVAKITLAEGLRLRVALVFIALLVTTLPLLCLLATGDGTVKGRLQMFVGYAIGLTGFYLSMLTIFFASRTLSAEIASQQIFGLASKPIPRWQILVGKWLGVTMLNVLMLTFALVATYAGTRYIVGRFERELHRELVDRGGLSEDQASACLAAVQQVKGPGGLGAASPIVPAMAAALGWSEPQVVDMLLQMPEPVRVNLRRLDEVRRQVLVSRASVSPPPRDLSAEVEKAYETLRAEGKLPDSPEWPPSRVREQLYRELEQAEAAIPPGRYKRWVLQGPPPEARDDFLLSVRYKIDTSVYSSAVDLVDGTTLPENTFLAGWIVGDPDTPRHYTWPPSVTAEVVRAYHEFEVPVQCVDPDGKIQIIMQNVDPRRMDVLVSSRDGLEVLYTVGSWEENLIVVGLAVLVPLTLLAAFGLLMSCFCTFPVAALVTLTLYCISGTRSFLTESLALSAEYHTDLPSAEEEFRRLVTDVMFGALSLGDLSPTDRIINGRAIRWPELGRDAAEVVLLRGGLVMALAVVIFRRRELAAIIV